MNNDVIYAHALGIAITDADLAEIEAQIESALPRPQYEGNSVISGGTRYCLARRTAGHNDTQLDGIMVASIREDTRYEISLPDSWSQMDVVSKT